MAEPRFLVNMHSPFHVIEEFISPLNCEEIISHLGLKAPNRDEKGQPLKYERLVPADFASNIFSDLEAQVPFIEQRYGAVVGANKHLLFQQYWENEKVAAEGHHAEGWKYARKKWNKTKDIDLVGILWLKDYHSSVPLDPRHEVYGGKIEFPGYNFSLTPTRGTLVLFPATPHFVTATSHIMLGTLEQIKVTMKLTKDGGPWAYHPSNFPGSYQEWFSPEE